MVRGSPLKCRFGFEFRGCRIYFVRIKIKKSRISGRRLGAQYSIGSLLDLLIHFVR